MPCPPTRTPAHRRPIRWPPATGPRLSDGQPVRNPQRGIETERPIRSTRPHPTAAIQPPSLRASYVTSISVSLQYPDRCPALGHDQRQRREARRRPQQAPRADRSRRRPSHPGRRAGHHRLPPPVRSGHATRPSPRHPRPPVRHQPPAMARHPLPLATLPRCTLETSTPTTSKPPPQSPPPSPDLSTTEQRSLLPRSRPAHFGIPTIEPTAIFTPRRTPRRCAPRTTPTDN